jgi:MoaA/NifB/PqqE/SkfB family radical SAM enzyme
LAGGRYDFIYDRMPISLRGMPWVKRVNLVRAGLNLLHRRLRPWSMPLHMQFEFVNYCTLRCPVCPTGTRELARPARAMDPRLFRQVLEEVGPYLLTASLWGWGESILHPELGELLRIAAGFDVVTFLSTNGQYLDRDPVIEAILAAPPSYLIVAIDGLTDETNAAFRKGAKLEPALGGVHRLAKLKKGRGLRLPVLHMRFMVTSRNEHELGRVEAFAADHGFDMLTIRTLALVDSERAAKSHAELVPEISDLRAYQHGDGEPIRRGDFICMQPFWFPSLYADGTVVCCEQDAHARGSIGAVGPARGFRDLWYDERATRERKTIRERPESLSFCRNCPARDRSTTDVSVRGIVFRPDLADPLIVRTGGLHD